MIKSNVDQKKGGILIWVSIVSASLGIIFCGNAETNDISTADIEVEEDLKIDSTTAHDGTDDDSRPDIAMEPDVFPKHSIEPVPIALPPREEPEKKLRPETTPAERGMTPLEVDSILQTESPEEDQESPATDADPGEIAAVEPEQVATDEIGGTDAEDPSPNEIRDLYYEALYDVQDELYLKAIPKLERVIELDPTLHGAWESLGWSYWKTGRGDETLKLWNRLKLLDPEHPLAYVLLASLALENENLEEARRLYEVALSKNPDQSFAPRMYNVRFSYARLIYWQGNVADSIGLLRELREEDPDRTDVTLALARAYLQAADYVKALPLWTRLRGLADRNTEYLASEALCLLHTGAREEAVEKAGRVLEMEPDNEKAITVLISSAMFGDTPEEALPHLKKLYRQQPEGEAKERIRHQLIVLYVYLHRQDPSKFSLVEPIELSRERLEQNPYSVDAKLLLAELLLMDYQLAESRDLFEGVAEDLNPYNVRARLGLFEIYLVTRKFDQARIQYEYIRRFDPHNMYLFYYLARIESTRGNFYEAHEMLEKLAQAGAKGAVAVLLYHGISPSDYSELLPIERFQRQMQALQDNRFRFIAPDQIPEYMTEHSSGNLESYSPELAVSVTFDDARRDSFEYAHSVAKEMGVRFAMHVPPPYVDDEGTFFVSWNELMDYNESGYWSLGSHLQNSSRMAGLNDSNLTGHPLANRIWLPEEERLETKEEYIERLDREYRLSKEILQEKLGGSTDIDFVAYPLGDIGQETRSNVDNAIELNIQKASEHYDVGFVQTAFGFAVNGDNPLLYQRYIVDRWDTGQDVVDHIYMNHPVFLSWRKRAEYAAFQGKQYLAQDLLERLEEAGYPENRHKKLKKFVHDRLSRKLAAPQDVGSVAEGPLYLRLRDPYVGAEFNWFEDNQDRENWSAYLNGGLNVTHGLEIQGKAGVGELKQKVRTIDHPEFGNELKFDEESLGGKAIYTFPNGMFLSGELVDRQYSSSRVNNSEMAYIFETQVRPVLALDLMFHYEHDMEPSALAVWEDITREQLMGVGVLRIRDWWDASAAAIRFDYSDDNTRDHLQVGTRFFLWERTGLNLGFKYAYATADEDRLAYWTPYKLHRYYIEPGFQGTYLRAYYDLRLRLGLGRESVRPEANVAFEEGLRRAAEGGYEPFRDEPPSEDWETIYGLSGSWKIPLSKYWVFNGRLGYNEGPSYEEFRAHLGLTLNF